MFDTLNITKAYKLEDNITGSHIDVATFNAVLHKGSNIHIYMNISYPNLYNAHKDAILDAYREFNAEVTSLACTMELSNEVAAGKLSSLEEVNDGFKERALSIFEDVISSLGEIQVNPIPVMEIPRY